MALDATVGGSSSNSFASLSEANEYFASRLYTQAWDALGTDAKKEAALIMATQALVSGICLTGSAATTTQALPFPRSGMVDRNGNTIPSTIIPQDIKNAEFEMALSLAKSDRTTPSDVEALGLTKLKAGPVELGFSGDAVSTVVPAFVTSLLPKSWLCPVVDDTLRPIVMEAM